MCWYSGPVSLYLILLLFVSNRFPNTTHEGFNATLHTTLVVTTKLVLPTPARPILPVQTGEQAQQEEQSSGMTIFFSLLVLGECGDTLVCHLECLCVWSIRSTRSKPPFTWRQVSLPCGFCASDTEGRWSVHNITGYSFFFVKSPSLAILKSSFYNVLDIIWKKGRIFDLERTLSIF